MKKLLAVACLTSTIIITGCQGVAQEQSPMTHTPHTTYNPSGGSLSIIQAEQQNQLNPQRARFGYVRHNKAQVRLQNRSPQAAYMDRELMADTISKMAVYLDGVEDCGTLVTDKYVLISYQGDDGNREQTLERVKMTAEAVVPRFYDVYVTDDPQLMDSIARFGSLASNSRDIERSLEATIEEIQKTLPDERPNQPRT